MSCTALKSLLRKRSSRIGTNSEQQQHSKNDVLYLENQEDVGVLRHKTNVKIDVN